MGHGQCAENKLKVAQSTLQAAQTKHRENHDKCLHDALEEKEKEIKDADDPKKAKKAAVAIRVTNSKALL